MKKIKNGLLYLPFIPFLLAIGYVSGYASERLLRGTTPFGTLVFLAMALAILLISMYVQIIIHELGHLIFGKLTGYRFSSFRIGSITLVHSRNKWALRLYRLPGTGGQCLMRLPEGDNMPYVWYNLGGILANIVISVLALIPVLIFRHAVEVVFPLSTLAIMGFVSAIANYIPFPQSANDGTNLRSMRKSAVERHAFRTQLLINEQMTAGVSLAEMPSQWFEFPENTDWNAPVSGCSATFIVERLICLGELETAKERCVEWLNNAEDMPLIAQHSLRADAILCELALNGSSNLSHTLRTKEFDAYIKSGQTPVALLLLWAYEKMSNGDEKLLQKYVTALEKSFKHYPYAGEVAMLRDLQKRITEQLER